MVNSQGWSSNRISVVPKGLTVRAQMALLALATRHPQPAFDSRCRQHDEDRIHPTWLACAHPGGCSGR